MVVSERTSRILLMVKESDGLAILEMKNQYCIKENCSIYVSCYREVQKQRMQSIFQI